MMTIGPIVKAAASGMLPDVPWYVSTALPMKKLEFPNSEGTMKSPSVSENVKMEPATTPGSASGRITCAESLRGPAPRSPEASTSDLGTRSSAVWIGRIM